MGKELKAIKILKKIYKDEPDTRVQKNNVDINFTIHDFSNIEEAIKELEEYESDMDKYLDYTTNSKCSKSFNSNLNSIKQAHDQTVEQLIRDLESK